MTSESDPSQEQRSSPQGGAGLAEQLSQGASGVAEQARERVLRTRERLEDELSQRRSHLGERLRDVSEVLDSASRKLGEDDFVADGLHYVSDRIERVASYIESADPTRLADDLRDAVRTRPAWFFGGAFVMGLALGRFAKSSAETLMDVASDDDEEGGASTGLQRAGSVQRTRTVPVGTRAGSPPVARTPGQTGTATPSGTTSAYGATPSTTTGTGGPARSVPPPTPNQGVRQS